MRTKQRTPDYGAISRASVRRDFKTAQLYTGREKRPQIENSRKIGEIRKVIFVGENSGYFKLRSFLVGRLVRLVEPSGFGNSWYCEFVNDEDRRAMNSAANWSDNKTRYLLDCVKFKD